MSFLGSVFDRLKQGKNYFTFFDALVLVSLCFGAGFISLQYINVMPQSEAQKQLWADMYPSSEAPSLKTSDSTRSGARSSSSDSLVVNNRDQFTH